MPFGIIDDDIPKPNLLFRLLTCCQIESIFI